MIIKTLENKFSLKPRVNLTHFWQMFPFHTPLKTPENQRFSSVFREYEMGTLNKNGLMLLQALLHEIHISLN